jgi:type II secretory ATPase GspE/PulE/Tfp pilus assembly ATPase PilB-like protein
MKEKKQKPSTTKPVGKSAKPSCRAERGKQPAPAELPAVRWVNQLLIRAIREGASDIHLESTREGLAARLRIDGVLHTVVAPGASQKDLKSEILSRIKAMFRIKGDAKLAPLDGRYRAIVDGRVVNFRTSITPTTCGEAVTIRVLDPGK